MRKAAKYSYLLYVLVPVFGYFLVVNYYTPDSFELAYKLECSENRECRFSTNEEHLDEIYRKVQEQINEAARLDEFSKPFSGFIRFRPRLTNKSTLDFVVSDPPQTATQNASVTCQLSQNQEYVLSYNSGIYFENKTSLSNVPETTKLVVGQLIACVRGIHTESDTHTVVGPGGTVSMQNVQARFYVEYITDNLSRLLIAAQVIAIALAGLLVFREILKFLFKGWRYLEL
jgi:hypothetical protein